MAGSWQEGACASCGEMQGQLADGTMLMTGEHPQCTMPAAACSRLDVHWLVGAAQ